MIVDILVLDEGSLTANLGRNFVVRKTSSGEEGNLLTTGNGVHDIDGGDTSLDHLLRILSLIGVNGLTLDVKEVFSEHSGALINWDTRTVELTTQHLCGDRHTEHITSELDVSLQIIDIRSTFENLK